jgi:hypothetical protein
LICFSTGSRCANAIAEAKQQMANNQARSRIDKNILPLKDQMGNGADYTGRPAGDRINSITTGLDAFDRILNPSLPILRTQVRGVRSEVLHG